MTLSPNVEADILHVYHAYWDAYLGGDMQTMSSCMDEACQIIGSGKGETFDDRAAALAYYRSTADQIVNKAEMRDRNIRLVPAGDLVQIIERSDFYVQVEDAWTYYGPARISTLMGRKGGAWKILHQHGSLPDARTGGGEQVNTDAIKQENYRLKDAIKRRTIELEQKNRELEIEAALERVRAVAMGMQTPEELADISAVIFTELKGLGFSDLRNTEVIINEPDKEAILSYYYSDYGVTGSIEVFYRSHPRVAGWFEELQKAGDGFATVVIGEDEIGDWRAYREAIGYRPDPKLDDADSVFYYSYATGLGALSISSFRPVSETQIRTLERFRNVFGLAYRRYADVDRARAQAREAQIEAALERVRARTMAMQRSEDLADLSFELVKQVQALGVATWFCAFNIYDEDGKGALEWGSNGEGVFPRYRTPREGIFLRYFEAGQRGETLLINEIGEDECPAHYAYLCTLPGVGEQLLKMKDAGLSFPTSQIDHVAYFKYGYLLFITYEPVPESHAIFKRFAKVFEQAYTRFLDLEQAEAQAREAQIEAALERVRARTMAMQRSEELSEAANLLFLQIQSLGIRAWSAGYTILEPDREAGSCVMSSEGVMQAAFRLPLTEEPSFLEWHDALERGDPFFVQELAGQPLADHYAYLMTLPDIRGAVDPLEAAGIAFPTHQFNHLAFFQQGFLLFITYESVPEAHAIFKRFAKVFEQTYTRFLDLKKAEAQAREAQIEAALERVRARTMAMQRSEELSEVAAVIYEQLNTLGFRTLQCGFDLVDPETHAMSHWFTNADGEVVPASGKASDVGILAALHPVTAAMFRAWERGDPGFFIELSGEDLDSYMAMVKTYLTIPDAAWIGKRLADVDRIFINHFHFSQGVLSARTLEPLTPEQRDVGFRFMKVFDLAYTRFLDLQKAEAQAREAVRQAALDRVRAEIASMRTAADLDRITPLLWRELTTLGIPALRCGVFIGDEDAARFRTHLSRPDGAALAAFDLPFDSAPTTDALAEHWRAAKVYREEWDRAQFVAWMQSMAEQGILDEAYPGAEDPPEALALLFAPFAQGMLYVGSPAPLSDDDVAGVQSLADAFAVAYARYEDFRKLEAAKAEVERAYDELHEAKDRLVQSEKLASLGALTAGIAHEIKNPLNFINNFAELNEELAEEVLEVLEAGDLEEARAILDDLRQNAAIINQHGKRADGIVRSMMQHARSGESRHEPVDVNAFVEEYLNLAYHGQRARVPGFNAELVTDLGADVGTAQMMPQEMGRVLINLLGNAFDAVYEQAQSQNGQYAPVVTVSTRRANGHVEIRVADNGPGIPAEVKAKIFEPFFTTKPTGAGTGLGLSLSHDIVTQGHGGTLAVESAPGEGATFVVTLPD